MLCVGVQDEKWKFRSSVIHERKFMGIMTRYEFIRVTKKKLKRYTQTTHDTDSVDLDLENFEVEVPRLKVETDKWTVIKRDSEDEHC